jgi:predicted dehydrogenase
MHVHDVDQMVWLFGAPDTCMTVSTHQMADYESTYSLYKCGETAVMILTDWGIHSSFPFSYGYNVTFEGAYIVSQNGKVTVYENGNSFEPEMSSGDCYYKEVNEFIEAVVDGKPFKTADVSSVYETMKVVFKEKEISKKK